MPRPMPDAAIQAIDRLADETPAFVYDLDSCRKRIESLRLELPFLTLYYAVKANPLVPLLRFIGSLGLGAEVASIGELRVAVTAGFAPDTIVFGGPAKFPSEIDEALALGIHAIHCESIQELEYALQRRPVGSSTLIAGRVNPEIGLQATIENMSGGPSRFGIDEEELIDWKDRNPKLWGRVDGLHLYQASQIRNWSEVQRTVRTLDEIASKVFDKPPRYLNYGGGFGIPMSDEQPFLDIYSLSAWWTTLTTKPSSGERAVELGRFIVGPIGHLLTTVIRSKDSRGKSYILTDGGINAFLRPRLTGEQHLIEVFARSPDAGAVDGPVSVVTGPLCTPIDEIGTCTGSALPGDIVVVHDAGAYGPSLSPTAFLGHPTPSEWLVLDGRLQQVRRRRLMTEYSEDGLIHDA